MWIGIAEFDFLLGDVHSLKTKRSLVRPFVAECKRRFAVAVAEVGHLDDMPPIGGAPRGRAAVGAQT